MNPNDPINSFQLVEREDGIKAVQIRIQVPEGFCWEDLGHKVLLFGTHYVNQSIIDAESKQATP